MLHDEENPFTLLIEWNRTKKHLIYYYNISTMISCE